MTAIANLPDLRPSLLLDFANSGRVDPRIQSTRASAATCFGPDGKLRTVPANTPRIDYDPATGKCLGLLVEEGRTNLLDQANNFADASWKKTAATLSVEQSHTLNPGASVTKFVESASEGPHNLEKFATVPGSTTYVCSIYVKAAGRSIIRINSGRNSTVEDSGLAQFDLSTGTITSNTNGLATMQHCGGGWYRCSITARAGEGSAGRFLVLTLVGTGGSTSYAGDGVSGVYLCNAQLELGTFPTSYIPTEASAVVTRAAETVQMQLPFFLTSANNLYLTVDSTERNPVLGFFTGLAFLAKAGAVTDYLGLINPSSVTHKRLQQFTGGEVKDGINSQVLTLGIPSKVAFAVNASRFAISANGSISESIATNLVRTQVFDTLHIGKFGVSPTVGSRVISRISIGIGDITNAQLQRLTA